MSTAKSPSPGTPATTTQEPERIVVISHSNLFYWWPVWLVGFLMAGLTYLDRTLLAVVPPGTLSVTEVEAHIEDKTGGKSTVKREAYVLPEGTRVTRVNDKVPTSEPRNPRVHISRNKNYGVVFCLVILLVIIITNVPMRGMWSLIVILTLVMLSIIFWLAEWWEAIFNAFHILDIRINMGGYLFLSVGLFIAWAVTVFFFDKQTYVVFESGQCSVCTEIGGGVQVYDTIGMTLQVKPSDLFRHKILGLGSGDLIVRTSGAQAHQLDLPNVLFISKKKADIERLINR